MSSVSLEAKIQSAKYWQRYKFLYKGQTILFNFIQCAGFGGSLPVLVGGAKDAITSADKYINTDMNMKFTQEMPAGINEPLLLQIIHSPDLRFGKTDTLYI